MQKECISGIDVSGVFKAPGVYVWMIFFEEGSVLLLQPARVWHFYRRHLKLFEGRGNFLGKSN